MAEGKKRIESERQKERRRKREASPKGKEIRRRIEQRRREKEKAAVARLEVIEAAEKAGTLVIVPREKPKSRLSRAAYLAKIKKYAPSRKAFWEKHGFIEPEAIALSEAGLSINWRARHAQKIKKGFSVVDVMVGARREERRHLRLQGLSPEEIERHIIHEWLKVDDIEEFIRKHYP